MKAQMIELGQVIAEHNVTRDDEGQPRVQGKLLSFWIYEVARDCAEIDEVRVYNGTDYVSFDIDRSHEPPRTNLYEVSSLLKDFEEQSA